MPGINIATSMVKWIFPIILCWLECYTYSFICFLGLQSHLKKWETPIFLMTKNWTQILMNRVRLIITSFLFHFRILNDCPQSLVIWDLYIDSTSQVQLVVHVVRNTSVIPTLAMSKHIIRICPWSSSSPSLPVTLIFKIVSCCSCCYRFGILTFPLGFRDGG